MWRRFQFQEGRGFLVVLRSALNLEDIYAFAVASDLAAFQGRVFKAV
jgi:hypothetical protein